MKNIIKITASKGSDKTPLISISGQWLENFGFCENDLIQIRTKRNKIILEKTEDTEKLTRMNEKNSLLYGLIKKFNLTPIE